MRAAGFGGVIVYCSDYRCASGRSLSADQRPDNLRLSDIEPRFICICGACGRRGVDVRPWTMPAAIYVAALPERVQHRPEWALAAETLMKACEGKAPLMLARLAMMKALHARQPPPEPKHTAGKKYRVS
ncbi:hypothetical protein ACQR1Y_11685 [Bradyrhizobium sp. HKCCYLRH3099]|uniref:hypothetical protein n=1 Tax=unclassified Bradyrhizobium TaxID=2631580 RepID=UPI003EBF02B1